MKKTLKKAMIIPALLCALSIGACTCPQEAPAPEPGPACPDACLKAVKAAADRAEAAAAKCESMFEKGLKK